MIKHVFPIKLKRRFIKFDGVRYRITGVRSDGVFAKRSDAPAWYPEEFFSFS